MPIKPFNEWGNYEAPVDATNIEEGRLLPNYISDALRGIARGVKGRVDQIFPKVVFEKRAGHNELVLKSGESLTPVADYMFMMILDGDSGDDFPELGDDDSGAAVNVRINNVAISLMSNDEVQVLWRDLYWLQSPTRANNRFLCYFSDTTTMHILLMSFPKTRSIDNTHLADESVTSDKILDGEIITANIADDAITADKIADNAVLSGAIADGAVLSGAIVEGAVTADKIEDGLITGIAKIATAEITALPSTFTYQFSRTATSQSPIYLRVMGKAHISDTDREVGEAANIDFVLRINSSIVSRNYFYLLTHGDEINDWTFSREFPFFVYYRIVSGSSFQMALDVVNGDSGDGTLTPELSTGSDNRIWVEELREVVNLA